MNKQERRERAQGTLEGSVWGLREAGATLEEVLAIVRKASAEWDPSPEPAFVIEDTPEVPGTAVVSMRRMDALKDAIDQRDWDNVEWHFDNVRRSLTKAFGLPR